MLKLYPNNQQLLIIFSRFLGYCGVQLNALIVPLLVFATTNNAALAGLALVFEWVPKLFVYLIGGAYIDRVGKKISHKALELTRLILLIAFILIQILDIKSVILIGIVAGVYQVCSAISNIIFEQLVTSSWEANERTGGHSKLLKADQLACFLMLCAGILISNLVALNILAVAVQLFTCFVVFSQSDKIHNNNSDSLLPTASTDSSMGDVWRSIGLSFKTLTTSSFVIFILCTFLFALPGAFVGSAFTYLLSQKNLEVSSFVLSQVGLIRVAVSWIGLQFLGMKLISGSSRLHSLFVIMGLGALALGCLALSAAQSYSAVLLFNVLLGAASILYLPFVRAVRQNLIMDSISKNSKISVSALTGAMQGVEAMTYLFAALLMMVFQQNVSMVLLLLFFTTLISAAIFMFKYKSKLQQ